MDIETTQQEETPDTTNSGGEATRDDLIAAAREAVGNVETEATKENAAGTPSAQTQSDPNDPTERINSVLRAREAAHQKRLEAENHAASIRQQAEEERRRIVEEARAEAKRVADEELSSLRARYRESPTAAIRALADNPQDIVDAVLREGTPEARALAKAQEEARLAREEAKEGKSAKEELAKFREELQQKEASAAYLKVRDDFIEKSASRAAAPALHAQFRSPDAVFRVLDAQCREWESDGLKRGVDFDDATLVAYAEKQSREWLREMGFSLSTPAQQSGAGAPSREPGIAPKSAANGTRTITAASSSERRASPKPFHELSPAEQREDLIRVAQEAYRQHGKT